MSLESFGFQRTLDDKSYTFAVSYWKKCSRYLFEVNLVGQEERIEYKSIYHVLQQSHHTRALLIGSSSLIFPSITPSILFQQYNN